MSTLSGIVEVTHQLRTTAAVQLGHACPQHYNPAEFVADLISIDYSSPELEEESKTRVQVLVDAWAKSEASKAAEAAAAAHKHMNRTSSGVLALGTVNAGPRAGWFRCVAQAAASLMVTGLDTSL